LKKVKVKSASGDHGKKSESEHTLVVIVASFKLLVISESEKVSVEIVASCWEGSTH